ncbi:K02A2.6-like [Cordylochernes scorpioides]|uniref:K02A2.6-like n=1 Tax=Cordylochernes scorpioides TaxID=51811 RepID=A0ABY6KPI5_9ARAC|nr:K02A2.6-like [Cordylochernes scorpioides]
MFTPVLAKFYKEIKARKQNFEVIFISSDSTEKEMFEYMLEAHGDWLALPHGSSVIEELFDRYAVSFIPSLIILNHDGYIITKEGKSDVIQKGTEAFDEWLKKVPFPLETRSSSQMEISEELLVGDNQKIKILGNSPLNYVDMKIEGMMTHVLVNSETSYSVVSERFRLKLRKIMFAETNVSLIPSESPWTSPVVLIRKKDVSCRFCVDYRRLNKITKKKDVYPLPRMDDTLDCLQGARNYYSMDLQSGYWQINVEESDCEKTTFITPDGQYDFKVITFGLSMAPAQG